MRSLFILLSLVVGNAACTSAERDNIELAMMDLANHLKIQESQVSLVSVIEKTWPDSSMGCPQPGMAYTQVLTEGSQLILSANGKQYFYHAKINGKYTFCAAPKNIGSKKRAPGGPDIST